MKKNYYMNRRANTNTPARGSVADLKREAAFRNRAVSISVAMVEAFSVGVAFAAALVLFAAM